MSLRITRFRASYIAEDLIQVKITAKWKMQQYGQRSSYSVNMTTNTNSSVLHIIGKHIITNHLPTKRLNDKVTGRGKTAIYDLSERDVAFLEKLKKHQKSYEMLRKIKAGTKEEVDEMLQIADIADELLN